MINLIKILYQNVFFNILSYKLFLERNLLKKISYSLHLGIVGSKSSENGSGREIFLDYLKNNYD